MTSTLHIAPRRVHRRAFTLIEVLMAVLILGIGLLGLGVVLPVVVLQQRTGTDQVYGTTVAQMARDMLLAERTGADSVQTITLESNPPSGLTQPEPLSGRFVIRYDAQATQQLPVLAEADQVRAALEALPAIGPGNVVVTRSFVPASQNATGRSKITYVVRFVGELSGVAVPPFVVQLFNFDGSARVSTDVVGYAPLNAEFWRAWAAATPRPRTRAELFTPPINPNLIPADATWMVPPQRGAPLDGAIVLGNVGYRVRTDPGGRLYTRLGIIPLIDRLYPVEVGRSGDPRLVWDIALRRRAPLHVPTGPVPPPPQGVSPDVAPPLPPEAFSLEAVVFVRRIDPRLRPEPNVSVIRSLTDRTLSALARRWPVSVNTDGEPTLDGRFDGHLYSQPVTLNVRFDPILGPDGNVMRDRLSVPPSINPSVNVDRLLRYLAQPGQKLVDNLGNVHTVIGLDDRRPADLYALRLARPIAPGVEYTDQTPTDQLGRSQPLRQIVFVPQVPVSVSVFTLNP
jgi:prepilin-type N-terminal cleavage/methylation domain-containing protein